MSIERFNRTIKQFNNRYFRATKNYNWFEIFDDVVYNYNHTYNNNIKGTPEDLTPEQIDEKMAMKSKKYYEENKDRLKLKK